MKQITGIWFPDEEDHIQQYLMLGTDGKGTYQYNKYKSAMLHMKRVRHAIDIGAHVGMWSRVMAHDFDLVTAFEPLPRHFECFDRNLKGYNNVQICPHGIAGQYGVQYFKMTGGNTGNSHVCDDGVPVDCYPLDSFGFVSVDFIKIDVEGYEYEVVSGAEKTIRTQKPVILIEQKDNGSAERYGRYRTEALDLLIEWGGEVKWDVGGDFLVVWE